MLRGQSEKREEPTDCPGECWPTELSLETRVLSRLRWPRPDFWKSAELLEIPHPPKLQGIPQVPVEPAHRVAHHLDGWAVPQTSLHARSEI